MTHMRKNVILGIVGSESAKFTEDGQRRAMIAIRELIREFKPRCISSGHCHLGGIDIWAEKIAKEKDCFDPDYIFKPRSLSWSYGFKPRNIQIAEASDILVCIVVDKLPDKFEGMRFPTCYHCIQRGLHTPHVKSGGCWTMHYAAALGKTTRLVVIKNGAA